ncbi:hypothetical protein DRP05_06340 [Archaeoglobales archaeon]|nr:MAG: hypothetical protein DRP05_06340 [Archaeoglobales archaeon]
MHASIWFIDDERKYDELEERAKKLLMLTKPGTQNHDVIARKIRQSYEIYGVLDDGDFEKVDKMLGYKPENYILEVFDYYIKNNFGFIYSQLKENQPKRQAELHSKWWKLFYSKDENEFKRALICIYTIFQQQKIKVDFNAGLRTTYYLVQAGKSHNRRDFKKSVEYLTKYWKVMWVAGGRISWRDVLRFDYSKVSCNPKQFSGRCYAD